MSSLMLRDTEAPIMERVCRLILDCKIQVGEITPEMLRKKVKRVISTTPTLRQVAMRA